MERKRRGSLSVVQSQSTNASQDTSQQLNPDWQNENTVLQSLYTICCNDIFSDVNFRFPNHHNVPLIPAHKVILAMRSSVFQAMFYGNFCETKQDVEITDITPDVFKSFLRFLYMDYVRMDNQSVIPLLYTADKYQIFNLKHRCQDYLKKSIDVNNVCEIMNAAEMFNITTLMNKSSEYIAKKARYVFQSDGFQSLTNSNLSNILSLEKLNVSEVDIFLACVKWSEQQCISKSMVANPSNKKNVLGNLLYQIRIPTMTLEDFSKHVATSNILSELEQLEFFKYFTIQEKTPIITKFPSTARKWFYTNIKVRLNKSTHKNSWKSDSEDIKEIIHISVKSQGRSDGPLHQKDQCNDTIVLQLRKIKLLESNINDYLCDKCRLLPTFNITTSRDEYDCETERQHVVEQPYQSNLPVNVKLFSELKITVRLKRVASRCPHCRFILRRTGIIIRHCEIINIGNVQLQIKCQGISLVESLWFKAT